MSPRIPQVSDVLQPKVSGFNIDCALPYVVLNIGVRHLVLRSYIVEREFIGAFRGPQKRGRIMRDETRLPAFCEILAWRSYDVIIGNERLIKPDHMACCGPHSDGIPPGGINADRGVGKVTCKQQQRFRAPIDVSCSPRSGGVYEQDGPVRSASAGGECLVAMDDIATVHFRGGGAKRELF